MSDADCVFCRIIQGEEPGEFTRWEFGRYDSEHIGGNTGIVLKPLNPVTPGHRLVIPARHVSDAREEPVTTANTYGAASQFIQGSGAVNLITSVGRTATQSVWHLHVHVVPRFRGDGLKLPWSRRG